MITWPHSDARAWLRRSMKEALTGKFSYTKGRLPQVWSTLQYDAEVEWVFKHFEAKGEVGMGVDADDLPFEDLFGDMFEEYHADTIPGGMRELKAQEKRAQARLAEDGQWYVETWVRDPGGDGWHSADGIGGFVGDDFYGSGYEIGLYMAALKRLFEVRGSAIPEYVHSKTGAWAQAVIMAWNIVGDNP